MRGIKRSLDLAAGVGDMIVGPVWLIWLGIRLIRHDPEKELEQLKTFPCRKRPQGLYP